MYKNQHPLLWGVLNRGYPEKFIVFTLPSVHSP